MLHYESRLSTRLKAGLFHDPGEEGGLKEKAFIRFAH